jgi:hypothetical protein
MTGYTLEANTPDRFNITVITREILMPYIFVNFIGKLKKLLLVEILDAVLTDVIVCLNF